MRVFAFALALTVSLPVSVPLFAQRYEIGAFAGYNRFRDTDLGSLLSDRKKDSDTQLRGEKLSRGARFTWNTKGYYGHEFSYSYTRGTVTAQVIPDGGSDPAARQDRVAIHQAAYNFMMYFMPAGEWWRPYFTAGPTLFQYAAPSFSEWTYGSSRNYGAQYGGGIKFLFGGHAIIRLDVRHTIAGQPYGLPMADEARFGGRSGRIEATVGVSAAF